MNSKIKIQELTKISLCVAILCVTSYLVIPVPFSPVVLGFQTIMVNLIGLMFKPKEAGVCILMYLLMGLIGLPVFSAGTGGPGKLFGPTGGFYFGFLVAVLLISFLKGKKISFVRYCIVTIVAGVPAMHAFAILFMCIHNGWNVEAAVVTVSLPFIIGDIVKCFMASTIGVALNRVLR